MPETSIVQAGMQLDGVTPAVARTGAMLRTAARAPVPPPAGRAADGARAAARFAAELSCPSAAPAAPAMTSPASQASEQAIPQRSRAIQQGCFNAPSRATRALTSTNSWVTAS
jgi:hypothetical protein